MTGHRSPVVRALCVLAAGAVLAACGNGPAASVGDGVPQRGGDLVAGIRTGPTTLDPAKCGGRITWQHCQPLYGTLLRYDFASAKFVPALAESFTSQDGQNWTLTLKAGVTFTDGTPFDAEAVSFNWERAKDPALASPATYWLGQMSWKVVDARTIEIVLAKANYQLPWAMQFELGLIGSPKAIRKEGDRFGSAPIGAGPFVLERFQPNGDVAYRRNEGYAEAGLPYADTLTLRVIPADQQRVRALQAGEINIDNTFLNKDAKALEAEGYPVYRMLLWGGTGLAFNYADPDLKDPDLRRALQSAFDAKQISAAAYPGEVVPDAWFPPGSPYRDEAAGMFPPFDPGDAQQLFDAYLSRTGRTGLSLSLSTYTNFPVMTQVSELLQSQLQRIRGLEVRIVALSSPALNADIANGRYQLAIRAAGASQVPAEVVRFFHSDGDLNVTGYSNPKVDEALDRTRTSDDPAVLGAAWRVVGAEVAKDAPVRLFAQENDIIITAKNVHGLNPAAVGSQSSELVWIDG